MDIPPGHDPWVIGGEPAVLLDISGNVSDFWPPHSPGPRLATMLMTDIVGSTKTGAEVGLVVFGSAEAALLCALAIRDVIRELGIENRYRCSYG